MSQIIEAESNTRQLSIREGHIDNSLFSKTNFQHYMEVATALAKSSMVPKNMLNKPADVLIAMEMGLQIGIPMMQAVQDIAVINGKPCIYGDGLLAVIQGHPDYEWIEEKIIRENEKAVAAVCTVKRRNHEPHQTVFSIEDAKRAQLWGKVGPWSQYPERMLQMRARGFCVRDTFSDALRGIKAAEEVADYQKPIDITPKSRPASKSMPVNEIEPILIENTKVSPRMLHSIDVLMKEIDFPYERRAKALEHYAINDFIDLTSEQAMSFLHILEKELKNKDIAA